MIFFFNVFFFLCVQSNICVLFSSSIAQTAERGKRCEAWQFDGPGLVGGEPSDQRLDTAVDDAEKRERVVVQRVVQKKVPDDGRLLFGKSVVRREVRVGRGNERRSEVTSTRTSVQFGQFILTTRCSIYIRNSASYPRPRERGVNAHVSKGYDNFFVFRNLYTKIHCVRFSNSRLRRRLKANYKNIYGRAASSRIIYIYMCSSFVFF